MKESIELHTIGIFKNKEYEMEDLLNGLLEENLRLDNIINKAIEYIEKYHFIDDIRVMDIKEYKKLLVILKGSDTNAKD